MTTADISNPILNSPYAAPQQHFELGPKGPTGEIREGRRPSESFIPVPASKKGERSGNARLRRDRRAPRGELRSRQTASSIHSPSSVGNCVPRFLDRLAVGEGGALAAFVDKERSDHARE